MCDDFSREQFLYFVLVEVIKWKANLNCRLIKHMFRFRNSCFQSEPIVIEGKTIFDPYRKMNECRCTFCHAETSLFVPSFSLSFFLPFSFLHSLSLSRTRPNLSQSFLTRSKSRFFYFSLFYTLSLSFSYSPKSVPIFFSEIKVAQLFSQD